MTDLDRQALDAAIVAAGLDPRNPAVRQSWQAGIEKYLEVRNSEAVAWQYAIGGDEWDLAADATEATRRRDFGLDVRPLFLAPSAGVETVKVITINESEAKALLYGQPKYEFSVALSRIAAWLAEQEDIPATPSSETDKEKGR